MTDQSLTPRVQRQRLTEAQWRDLIEQCASSGLTQEVFCKERGVSVCTFRDWKHRLFPGRRSKRGQCKAAFVPVDVTGVSAQIEIVLTNGRVLRVSGGVDSEAVSRLATALERTAC